MSACFAFTTSSTADVVSVGFSTGVAVSSSVFSTAFVSFTTGASGFFLSETSVLAVSVESVPSAAFDEPGAIISENPNMHDTKPIDSFLVPYLGVFSSLNSLFFSMISFIFFEFFITFLSFLYSTKVFLQNFLSY